jgi:NADH-quinone oxidoreductase subunit F
VDGVPAFADLPMMRGQVRVVLRNAGIIDPARIEHYVARGGYAGLAKAVTMTPEAVIEQVKAAGLRGRGGAGFPTGVKWGFAREAKGKVKYVICNADEGDPGAFMDRAVLESDPHAVLEGLAIAAYAVGAHRACVYVRAEYPLAIERLRTAIRQMTDLGLAGASVLGTGFGLAITIKEGAGAFVCGEETALIASIEGRRGMPRARPPFPAQRGLHDRPTNINNVETLANVPAILRDGAARFAGHGTEESRGTKTFALAGKINRTGLIEVPMGISLRDIIYRIGGGIPDGKAFKAVQTGGPSGGCLPAELLDLPVDYGELAEAGSIMGSGGMIVMDEDSCIVDVARYFLQFTHDESCGKCVPCRMGSQHLLYILTEITEGRGTARHIERLEALAGTVRDGSLCGLGQTLPNPVLSVLRYFRPELEQHVVRKECDALVCRRLVSSPCQYTCPIHQDAPCYIGYIARGEFDRALGVVRRENPFPSVCGRVCPHPCEGRCEAGREGEPIAIRALKRFVTDNAGDGAARPAARRYPEKVAVVGSGPAGLTAACRLAQEGYACTVFEALPVAGGMLAVAIPEYRLPRDALERDIRYIRDTGVQVVTGKALGKDFSLDDLFAEGYGAVFLAFGAHRPYSLKVPGEEHPAAMAGLAMLREINLGRPVQLGRRVAVVGGGNVAVDSARAALRLGAAEVIVVYRRSEAEMPAWPEERRLMAEEGIRTEFLAAPVRIVVENGRLTGMECLRMELGEPDASGRRRPVPIEGSNFVMGCDNVIAAIGQTCDVPFGDGAGIALTDWGTVQADPDTLATARAGVFAGGDAVLGPADVVGAIAHGKRAAASIHQYLRGQEVARRFAPVRPAEHVEPVELAEEELETLARPVMPARSPRERLGDFLEVDRGLSREAAVREAKRCLRCDLAAAPDGT